MGRATFYISQELLKEISDQAKNEHSSRSHLISSILSVLLLSPQGQELRAKAKANNRLLVQELENHLKMLLNEHKDLKKLSE